MSSSANPISPAAFRVAIKDLPLANLYGKAAELQNSIAHLHHSNEQLKPFAEDGDPDCADALRENEGVVGRMEERIQLLRREVDDRGARWMDAEVEEKEAQSQAENGHAVTGTDAGQSQRVASTVSADRSQGEAQGSGRLTDEEIRSRLREMVDIEDLDDDGVHL